MIDFSNDIIEQAKKAYQQTGIMSYALAIGAKHVLDKQPAFSKESNQIYCHLKTGGYYELLSEALNESDLTKVCVYRSLQDGKIWVRPSDEFFDGRFVSVGEQPQSLTIPFKFYEVVAVSYEEDYEEERVIKRFKNPNDALALKLAIETFEANNVRPVFPATDNLSVIEYSMKLIDDHDNRHPAGYHDICVQAYIIREVNLEF